MPESFPENMVISHLKRVKTLTKCPMKWLMFYGCLYSLHFGQNDIGTFYDGTDLTANILGQYGGTLPKFRLDTAMADVTIKFQSDPATNIYGYNNGFVVHFFGR